MEWLYLAVGCLVGFVIGYAIRAKSAARETAMVQTLMDDWKVKQQALVSSLTQTLKTSIQETTLDALSKSSESVARLAGQHVEGERKVITSHLENTKEDLNQRFSSLNQHFERIHSLVSRVEKDSQTQWGKLSSWFDLSQQQTRDLLATTASLNSLLAGSQTRGQLGERIADDILRLAGYIENVNYQKQRNLANGTRPDFVFLLPKNQCVVMDVKFPIQNYSRYLDATSLDEKEKFKKLFFADVRAACKELISRNYMEATESLDCMLMFIPHEQLFSFIQQEDPGLFEWALKNRIISCSPMTLFAVLSVIRSAVEQFTLEKTSKEMLEHMLSFRKQWDEYQKSFSIFGKKIKELGESYDTLENTRGRLLQRQFEKFEKIQQSTTCH